MSHSPSGSLLGASVARRRRLDAIADLHTLTELELVGMVAAAQAGLDIAPLVLSDLIPELEARGGGPLP